MTQHIVDEKFVPGILWSEELQKLMLSDDWKIEEITRWSEVWIDALRGVTGSDMPEILDKSTILDGKFLDAIPKNLVVGKDGNAEFFDLEWHTAEKLELGYLLVRGWWDSLAAVELSGTHKNFTLILELVLAISGNLGFDISKSDVEMYLGIEHKFQKQVSRVPGRHSIERLIATQISYGSIGKLHIKQQKMARRRFEKGRFRQRILTKLKIG